MNAQTQGNVNGNRKSPQSRQLKIYTSRADYEAGAAPVNVSPARTAISAADFADRMVPLEFGILWGEDGRMIDAVEIPESGIDWPEMDEVGSGDGWNAAGGVV